MKSNHFSRVRNLIRILFIACLLPAGYVCASESPSDYIPLPLPKVSDYQSGYLQRGSYPTSYDSRRKGYVTSVKDQEPWGSCWAFGAMAAGESSMLRKGLVSSPPDLSELHLSYFVYNSVTDPLGNTKGDKTRYLGSDNYLERGGNNLLSMFTLAKWTGAASESLVPYHTQTAQRLSSSLAYKNSAHMQNARFVSSGDKQSIKDLITRYGAVSTSVYYDDLYINHTTSSLYVNRSLSYSNHVVTLVGWDDNYSRDKFKVKPSGNGAWIAKNSYGTSSGDKGYIYISYEDKVLNSSSAGSLSFSFDMERSNNYDYNYQYDGSASIQLWNIPSGGSMSNVFQVKGRKSGNEKLEAVSFALFTPNVTYRIQIYQNPQDGNPASGTPLLSTPQTGRTTYGGYYTIPLKKQPVLKQGSVFSVVITFYCGATNASTLDGTPVLQAFVDYSSLELNAGIEFVSASSKNQSFFRSSSSDTWFDLHQNSQGAAVARIKAFTSATGSSATVKEAVTTALKRPDNIKFSSPAYNRVTLKWARVKNARGYELYRSTSKKGVYRRIATPSKTSYTDSTVSCANTYYYKLRAYYRKKGKTYYSKFSSVKKIQPVLGKAVLTNVTDSGAKVTLTWRPVKGATGYVVYRAPGSSGKYRRLATLTGKQKIKYTYTTKKRKSFRYRVRSYRIINNKTYYGALSNTIRK